ncbi:MAG: hypothetical protein ACXWBP_13785 [Limisphaerales bacterium]
MQMISKFLVAGSILALAACNSSSVPTPGGALCPNAYNPYPVAVMPGTKAVPMNPADNKSSPTDSQMPPGRYTYSLGDIIYTQKNIKDPIQIHYHDATTGGVSVKESVTCMINAKTNMNIASQETDAVTDIIVCPDYSQVVKARHFHFGILNSSIFMDVPTVTDPKNLCLTSSVGVYHKTSVDPVILKAQTDNVTYEIRSQTDLPDGSASYVVATRFFYTPFTALETAGGALPPECVTKCFPTPPPATPAPTTASKPKTNSKPSRI